MSWKGGSAVADRRRTLGLSQAHLARAAGLTRPLVSAVETGRHIPSVKAAIAIAAALATSVEELFGEARLPGGYHPMLGAEPDSPAGVLVVRVGEQIAYHPVPEGTTSWASADGVYRDGRVTLFEDADPSGIALAGCDPALGLAASLLPGRGPRRAVAVPAASEVAIKALDEGRIHAALVHGRPGRLGAAASDVRRFMLARWRVGLAFRPGSRVDLDSIARGDTTITRRDPQAEITRALERRIGEGALARLRGPEAGSHLDAARRVTYGTAEAALTMEAAARAYGLDFVELEEHVAQLQVDRRWGDLPAVEALVDLIGSGPFRARLDAVGGYDVTGAGEEV